MDPSAWPDRMPFPEVLRVRKEIQVIVGWLVDRGLRLGNNKGHIRIGEQLVTVHTHGNFIVLPHWETRPPAP